MFWTNGANGKHKKQRYSKKEKTAGRLIATPDSNHFFDTVTGSPRLWYWRGDKGEYEFFECPGFNPRNGQPLMQFTKDVQAKYLNEVKEKQADLRAEQDRQREEQAQRERKTAQDKADRERRAQDEATKRSEAGRKEQAELQEQR